MVSRAEERAEMNEKSERVAARHAAGSAAVRRSHDANRHHQRRHAQATHRLALALYYTLAILFLASHGALASTVSASARSIPSSAGSSDAGSSPFHAAPRHTSSLLAATTNCASLASNCTGCTASGECGWCVSNYPGVAPLCLAGNVTGPSANAGGTCEFVDWSFGTDADTCPGSRPYHASSKWPLAGVMAVITFAFTPILAAVVMVLVARWNRRVVAAAVTADPKNSSSPISRDGEHTHDDEEIELQEGGIDSELGTDSIEAAGIPASGNRQGRARTGFLNFIDWSSRPVAFALVLVSLCEVALKGTAIGEDEWDSEFYPGTQAEVYYGVLTGRAVYPSSSTVTTTYTSMCKLMDGAEKGVCLSLCASGGFLLFLGCCSVLLTIICVFVHCLSLRFPYLRGQFAASVRTLVHANTLVAVTAAITWIGTVHWLVHTMDRSSSLGPSFYIWLASIAVSVVHAAATTRAVMDTISANTDEYHSLQLK